MRQELPLALLNSVEKPARYTGMELNSIVKDVGDSDVVIALAFPDIYEVGMSYLGFKILYHILNKIPYVAAQRTYAPWVDIEAKMREKNLMLTTLEEQRPLKECDILGFTLQYELSYSNILNMLDLGGVPVLKEERGEDAPLVIAGGPCVYNPEPLVDFIDLFVIGEGEEVMVELMEAYHTWKVAGKAGGKRAFLLRVAREISGLYVPEFYSAEYEEDGTFKAIKPTEEGIPTTIYKRIVKDLNTVDFPTAPIVPYGDIVHNRIMLEIFRGCSRGCRFCHAGMVYRPVRERKVEVLREIARKQVDNTGYNEISLVSLSSADYSRLPELVHSLISDLHQDMVSVSLPSLRIDSFSVEIAKEVQAVRKSGLTFAPEAGSQRMRDVINKGVTEADLMQAVATAFANGWSSVKLYFMLGLPTETDEDVLAIADLAKKVQYRYKEVTGKGGAKVTVSVASFVPKPYTAFQWCAQNSLAEICRKQQLLKDALRVKNITFQYHEGTVSVMEGVIARGDRRLGQVIYNAWRQGAQFDGWSDHFSYEIWQRALESAGLNAAFYATRERKADEAFPWEHISPGVSRSYLAQEYAKSQKAELTTDCRHNACTGCGVCGALEAKIIDWSEEKR